MINADDRFSGMLLYQAGAPSLAQFRVRGNKLSNPMVGGPAEFEIRGSRIYRIGNQLSRRLAPLDQIAHRTAKGMIEC